MYRTGLLVMASKWSYQITDELLASTTITNYNQHWWNVVVTLHGSQSPKTELYESHQAAAAMSAKYPYHPPFKIL